MAAAQRDRDPAILSSRDIFVSTAEQIIRQTFPPSSSVHVSLSCPGAPSLTVCGLLGVRACLTHFH